MRINETAHADAILDEVKRGETYAAEFELYRNGQADPGCCELQVGDPLDLRAYTSVRAVGKVVGTDRDLLGVAAFVSKGGVAVPARIEVAFAWEDLELCFDPGAQEQFLFQVIATAPGGRAVSALCGTVDVIPSATGGLRG